MLSAPSNNSSRSITIARCLSRRASTLLSATPATSSALFVGYCAEHTLGAAIVSGRSPVNIFGEPYEVRAKVASLDAFSGHADRNELKRYVSAITGDIKKIAVIHGEEDQALAFVQTLKQMKPKAEVFAPVYQQAGDF
jgi:metallo-beta-lactamase family protein